MLGLLVATSLFANDLGLIILPCSSTICGLVASDPINHFFHIPISAFGLAFYLASGILAVRALSGKDRTVKYLAVSSSVGAFVSIALVLYSSEKYRGVCPYCLCSAICSVSIAICSTWLTPNSSRKRLGGIALVPIGVAGAMFFGVFQSQFRFTADLYAVQQIDAGSVLVKRRLIRQSDRPGARTFLVVADLECHACRRALRTLTNAPINLYFCAFDGGGEIARCEAIAMYRHPDPTSKSEFLRTILASENWTIQSIEAIPSVGDKDEALKAVELDQVLSKSLKVSATPVVIEATGGNLRVLSTYELNSMLVK